MTARRARKAALRTLRRATAVARERAGTADDAPLVIVMVDEATELLKGGWGARACRRELSRLAALGRSENVAVFTRADDGGRP